MTVVEKIINCLVQNGYTKDTYCMAYKDAYTKYINDVTIQVRFKRNMMNTKLVVGGRILYGINIQCGRKFEKITNLLFDLERILSIFNFH